MVTDQLFFFGSYKMFHCHIWMQRVKCIQMSTNKPSFGPMVLEIARLDFDQIIKFELFTTCTVTML